MEPSSSFDPGALGFLFVFALVTFIVAAWSLLQDRKPPTDPPDRGIPQGRHYALS